MLFCQVSSAGQSHFYESPQKKSPVVLFVHGGALVNGHAYQYNELAKTFNSHGLCLKIVEYRLAPNVKHPAPVEDLDQELMQTLNYQSKNCDMSRVFLMGHSAGAHMIAFWSTEHSLTQIKGFIGLEGIYDLPNLAETWPSYPEQFLNSAFGPQSLWAKASPQRRAMKSHAPWLIIHSRQDELVDLKQSKDFKDHLLQQKINVKFSEVASYSHFEVVKNLSVKNDSIFKMTLQFIRSK